MTKRGAGERRRRQNRSGQIVEKGPDRWLCRWSDGRDARTGRWVTHSKVVRGTRLDAEAELAKVQVEKNQGSYLAPTQVTVGEALDRWLDALRHSSKQRAAKTLDGYESIARVRIKPVIGALVLRELRGPEVERVYATLRERGKATRTVAATHQVLRAFLRWAEGKGQLLVASPMRHVEAPPQGGDSRRAAGLSADQVRAFLAVTRGTPHAALFVLLFGTGCRPGEALALRWSDVDLEHARARIERNLSRPGGRYDFRAPKTPRSRREIPLAAGVVRALREHRRGQAEHRLSLGAVWEDLDLVFAGATGGPLDELAVYRWHFRPLAKKAGLDARTRLYDARHTFASLALTGGIPVHEVSKILGHSTVTLTLNTYSHLLPDRAAAATDAVGAAIFG